jgi:hypothetical protein
MPCSCSNTSICSGKSACHTLITTTLITATLIHESPYTCLLCALLRLFSQRYCPSAMETENEPLTRDNTLPGTPVLLKSIETDEDALMAGWHPLYSPWHHLPNQLDSRISLTRDPPTWIRTQTTTDSSTSAATPERSDSVMQFNRKSMSWIQFN